MLRLTSQVMSIAANRVSGRLAHGLVGLAVQALGDLVWLTRTSSNTHMMILQQQTLTSRIGAGNCTGPCARSKS